MIRHSVPRNPVTVHPAETSAPLRPACHAAPRGTWRRCIEEAEQKAAVRVTANRRQRTPMQTMSEPRSAQLVVGPK